MCVCGVKKSNSKVAMIDVDDVCLHVFFISYGKEKTLNGKTEVLTKGSAVVVETEVAASELEER